MENMSQLIDAHQKITVELIKSMTYSQKIELNSMYTLYHYSEDDLVVLVRTEDWVEEAVVLYDDKNNTITFEMC